MEFASEQKFVDWYEKHKWYHGRLARLVAQFLEWQVEEFFRGMRLPVLAKVSHREKSIDSLARNIEQQRYGGFPLARDAIGDLAGVRIVFYFRDDVEHFCDERVRFFQRWFGRRSYELRKVYDSASEEVNRRHAGYTSWHFPIRVEPDTDFYRALNETDRRVLRDLDCEVQLRTALQDTWAECNHDIRYKDSRVEDTRRNETARQRFLTVSLQLRDIDRTLVELKEDFTQNVALRSEKPRRQKKWRYSEPTYPRAARIRSVDYGYELLDYRDPRGRESPFEIAVANSVFHVDTAMAVAAGTQGFKQEMWERLQREAPQFVIAITRDSMVVRATDWLAESRTLSVELATYSDQVVTNHRAAADKAILEDPRGRTVGDLAVDQRGNLLAFRDSPLSNTVGVSCIMRTFGNLWVIALRSPYVAYDPGTWGCSASKALNWVELGNWGQRDFDGWFRTGIVREVEERLGFIVDRANVHYLGLAREFGRLGKPQVFFFIDAVIGHDNLSATFRTYRRFDSEYKELRPFTAAQARDLISNDEKKVNAVCGGATVGEELRFNLALALEYVGEHR